ncbi:hypothetical protein A0J48_026300 [Sphaerospermopsis aphanizomenoides BCCUSP55]|nr:hypothetical protein [Sphaerospermopsis aphanizomenoides BCCUSP55]
MPTRKSKPANIKELFQRLGEPARAVHDLKGVFTKTNDWRPLIDAAGNALRGPAFKPENMPKTMEWARDRLDGLPAQALLEQLQADLRRCLLKKAAFTQMAVLVGFMLDAFKAKPTSSSENFVTALLMAIDEEPGYDEFGNLSNNSTPQSNGWSAEVIASATKLAVKVSPFQPSISEFLELLRQSSLQYHVALRRVQKLLELTEDADHVVRLCTIEDLDASQPLDDIDRVPW